MDAPPPIPPSYLVLHKLKQWDDYQNNPSNNQNSAAALKSVRTDLTNMLRNLRYTVPPFTHDPTYDVNFHNESAPRVDRFLARHNIYGKEWRQMGFCRGLNVPAGARINNATRGVPEGLVRPTEGSARARESPIRPKKKKTLSPMQIRTLAAQTTVAILTELGLPCAIFGSMACKIYGNERIPNDVDILVLPPPERGSITQEEIKALIAQHPLPNYHFILKPARDPRQTYKVLHFVVKPRPPSITRGFASMNLQDRNTPNEDEDDDDDDNISQGYTIPIRVPRRFSSKVDILLPGVMHLPALPTSKITYLSSLPLVPFPVLLLQKLQGWSDHRAATEARYRAKIGDDARDLQWCLTVLVKYAVINKNEMWSDRTMFSEEFEALSRARVREFCQVYTGLRETWKAIGFDV